MNTRFALLACLAFAAACHNGSSSTVEDMLAPPDLVPPGDMATPYPAIASPDVPQVESFGGPVMSAPKVVVVTFPGEQRLTDITTFVSTLGQQSYWAAATSEYGIGPITMATAIQDPTAPAATITDTDIQNYLASMLDGTHPEWPAPDDNTIYALFYPSTTSIDDGSGSMSCSSFGGYHADAGMGTSNQRIVYAVLPRCTGVFTNDPNEGDFGYLTSATSHELIEASEDPFPFTNPAYADTDDAHFPWGIALGGGESADLCAQNADADFQPTGFDYWVQRNWSNKAATAAQNPCVPASTSTVYANISPVTPFDPITVGGGGFSAMVDGFVVQVGVPRELELELYSVAPIATPISVQVLDATARENGVKSKLTMTWDSKTGTNGSKLHLSVTANEMLSGHGNTTTIWVTTIADGVPAYWFTLIKSVAATSTPDMGT